MKKQNQIERKSSKEVSSPQAKRTEYREVLISRRSGDVLKQLAAELKADARAIGENAIESYLAFIEKRPELAEAQPRFIQKDWVFAVAPTGDLYDRLYESCRIYDLDPGSVVDSAIGAYLDLVVSHAKNDAMRELTLSYRGSSDPENIEFVLSKMSESASSLFDQLVQQIAQRPLADACDDLSALRELVMHHPALKKQRVALEMVAEGGRQLLEVEPK
jgi:hypothetical protein